LAGLLTRIRNGRIVDQHVKPAQFLANALRSGGDRPLIRYVELERAGLSFNRSGRSLATLQIARSDQYDKAERRKILCDLQTDSLVCPGD
jgi:hypothetical protein